MRLLKTKLKKAILNRVHRQNELDRSKRSIPVCLPPALWDLETGRNGHLFSGGADLNQIAREYGTPLHVVDKKRLEKNYFAFVNAFKKHYPQVEITYSYKTNPLPGALKILHDLGAGAEVISHFELWLALKMGVPVEKIVFNGPAKTDEALDLAVASRIKSINIDSEDEIDKIAALAKKYGHQQEVGVRVVTTEGWSSQFGIPIKNGHALQIFERLVRIPHVVPQCIHIHLGTGIKSIETYTQAVKQVLDLAVELKQQLGLNLQSLNYGGGFGVPCVQSYSYWDNKLMLNHLPPASIDPGTCPPVESYGKALADVISPYLAQDPEFRPTIYFEPGRVVTSSAQILLLKIIAIKPGPANIKYAVADGGINIASSLGSEHHEVFAVARANETSDSEYYNIVGPLCCPHDVLFSVKKLPQLKAGDILAVMDAGAYLIPCQTNFSNPRPSAVVVEDGKCKLERERESFEHVVALDAFQD